MKHGEFKIGTEFSMSGNRWRCTDIGSRVIIAIRINFVVVAGTKSYTLTGAEADAQGWFKGPPYPVAEHVIDENDQEECKP